MSAAWVRIPFASLNPWMQLLKYPRHRETRNGRLSSSVSQACKQEEKLKFAKCRPTAKDRGIPWVVPRGEGLTQFKGPVCHIPSKIRAWYSHFVDFLRSLVRQVCTLLGLVPGANMLPYRSTTGKRSRTSSLIWEGLIVISRQNSFLLRCVTAALAIIPYKSQSMEALGRMDEPVKCFIIFGTSKSSHEVLACQWISFGSFKQHFVPRPIIALTNSLAESNTSDIRVSRPGQKKTVKAWK